MILSGRTRSAATASTAPPAWGAELWLLRGDHAEALDALEAEAADRIPFGATSFWWEALYDPA